MSSFSVSNLFNFSSLTVLVTGGGKGIGRMIAEAFTTNGSTVYISGRDSKALNETSEELTKSGPGTCIPIVGDLGSIEGVRALASEMAKRTKSLNVLVNNAGTNWGAPLEKYPVEAFDKVMMLNVTAVFALTVGLLPLLRAASTEENPSRVINIGSINGIDPPTIENYAYAASKAALHMLTRCETSNNLILNIITETPLGLIHSQLASRLASENILVNALACGPFETKMMSFVLKNFREQVIDTVALRRVGTPEDVGGACLFLASKAAKYV